MFKEITSSATRVVLVLIILTLCVISAYIAIVNAQKEIVITTILGIFSNVAVAIVAFYFGRQSSKTVSRVTTDTPVSTDPTLQV